MKTEVIFGQKPINPDSSYIELKLDGNKLQVDLCNEGAHSVWHLIMNDVSKYDALKEEFAKAAKEIFAEAGDIGYFIDVIQGQDIHDDYDLEYDVPANDTAILVSLEEIDEYVKEVSARLLCEFEGSCNQADAIKFKINPKKPLGDYSYDYWAGVMSTLNWITMGSEKHDTEPQ